MKDTVQYFRMNLFNVLYKVILPFESVDEILKCDHSDESHGAVLTALFIMLHKVVQPFEYVDEILIINCDYSRENIKQYSSSWYSSTTLHLRALQSGFNF